MENQRDQLQLEKVGHLQELVQSRRDVTQLTTEVEQLRKEKADLLGEVEAHKITVRHSHVTVTISCVHWWNCILRVLFRQIIFLVCACKVT